MPNQRDANKKHVGGYLDEELCLALAAIARARFITVTELLEEFVAEGLQRRAAAGSSTTVSTQAHNAQAPLRNLSH